MDDPSNTIKYAWIIPPWESLCENIPQDIVPRELKTVTKKWPSALLKFTDGDANDIIDVCFETIQYFLQAYGKCIFS